MKIIKASYIWSDQDFKHSLISRIIESYFDVQFVWTTPAKCDLLFIGPYRPYKKIKEKFLNSHNKIIKNFLNDLERGLFFRKHKPLTIFHTSENERVFDLPEDFKIGTDYNYSYDESYLRIPVWKDRIDWSHLKLLTATTSNMNAKRFGGYYNLSDLMSPQGSSFLKKNTRICCFFSHLLEPRKSLIKQIKKSFNIDGYGKAFDAKIKNHNSSSFIKKEILKNYFANFCPENSLYPGYYTEKVPDAFISKSLPITWADQNIKNEFNPNAFINLNDFDNIQITNFLEEIKDKDYLLKFTKEPLLLTQPNLDNEINFAYKIVKNFI